MHDKLLTGTFYSAFTGGECPSKAQDNLNFAHVHDKYSRRLTIGPDKHVSGTNSFKASSLEDEEPGR